LNFVDRDDAVVGDSRKEALQQPPPAGAGDCGARNGYPRQRREEALSGEQLATLAIDQPKRPAVAKSPCQPGWSVRGAQHNDVLG
jgi:hypothetical protein